MDSLFLEHYCLHAPSGARRTLPAVGPEKQQTCTSAALRTTTTVGCPLAPHVTGRKGKDFLRNAFLRVLHGTGWFAVFHVPSKPRTESATREKTTNAEGVDRTLAVPVSCVCGESYAFYAAQHTTKRKIHGTSFSCSSDLFWLRSTLGVAAKPRVCFHSASTQAQFHAHIRDFCVPHE